jgi:putative transposase
MARLPGFIIPEQPRRIIQRGNHREIILADSKDLLFYLDYLRELTGRYGLLIHAYVFMTNPMHLPATPESEDSIPKVMHSPGGNYVQYVNSAWNKLSRGRLKQDKP